MLESPRSCCQNSRGTKLSKGILSKYRGCSTASSKMGGGVGDLLRSLYDVQVVSLLAKCHVVAVAMGESTISTTTVGTHTVYKKKNEVYYDGGWMMTISPARPDRVEPLPLKLFELPPPDCVEPLPLDRVDPYTSTRPH